MKNAHNILLAALLAGAAALFPLMAMAGSCCGGGSGAALVLPAYARAMVDVSVDLEKYDGFWNQGGHYTPDPAGSDLRQYRLTAGYAQRLAERWQAGIVVPYVWNDNRYAGLTSRTDGLGDTSLNLWYEAFDDLSAWKVRNMRDMLPSVTIGPSLLIPTGVSPYDEAGGSFDVTGRGFYRLDGNLLVAKTLHPWSASLALSYGTYRERAVNREYGRYVDPYRKKLGDRTSASLSLGYRLFIGSGGDSLTGTVTLARIHEADASINGSRDRTSGFGKDTVGAAIAYGSTDHDWGVRLSWNHSVKQDGWGENFPATDVYTVGVSHVFR